MRTATVTVGHNRCQCAACKEYFNSVAAFDKHRTGRPEERRCMTEEEMRAKGMDKNQVGYWVTALHMSWDGFKAPRHIVDKSERDGIRAGREP